MEAPENLTRVAQALTAVLDGADVMAFSDLLDPHVTWGPPGDPSPPCSSRQQVLAWYTKGRESGIRASVSEATILDSQVLIGLVVHAMTEASEGGGGALRWQLYSVRDGLVVDIVGFDSRDEALDYARSGATR